ncbi:hypothetical protein ACFSHQ_21205 [Gemmobacter lanyuensis]
MDSIEQALVRLTAKTEEVELKLNRVVSDGTNRLGDLEFRVTELEGGDIGAIPETPPLGGDTAAAAPAVAPAVPEQTPTSGGRACHRRTGKFRPGQGVLGQGDFRAAAQEFDTFAQSYPGSPLMQEAQILKGDALKQMGTPRMPPVPILMPFRASRTVDRRRRRC